MREPVRKLHEYYYFVILNDSEGSEPTVTTLGVIHSLCVYRFFAKLRMTERKMKYESLFLFYGAFEAVYVVAFPYFCTIEFLIDK